MKFLALIPTSLVAIIIFGLPWWRMAQVFNIDNLGWLVIPGFFAILSLVMPYISHHFLPSKTIVFLKRVSWYWLGIGGILCTVTVGVSFLDLFVSFTPLIFMAAIWFITLILVAIARRRTFTIDTHYVNLSSSKITQNYRFVQLSDVHIGSNSKKDLENVVDHILRLDPDFVVITGDLVDEDHVTPEDLLALDDISVPMYFVSGNHEYYIETDEFRKSLAYTSVQDIEDKKTIFEELDIIGVDETSDVKTIVQKYGVDSNRYTMVLYHEPKTSFARAAADAGVDLMLSGHTHNGQIWPFTYFVEARFPYIAGMYDVGDMQLFVSQGTQTWGPKMRLGTRNEIILFELQPE